MQTEDEPVPLSGQAPGAETTAGPLADAGPNLAIVRAALDCVAVATALGVAVWLRFGLRFLEVTEQSALTARSHWTASIALGLGLITALAANRLYDEDTLVSSADELRRVVRSALVAGAVIPAFVFMTQSFYVSRSWFALALALSITCLAAERLALRRVVARARAQGRLRRPAILVSTETGSDWFSDPTGEFEVVADVDADGFGGLTTAALADRKRGRRHAVVLRARDFGHEDFWRIVVSSGELGWTTFVHSPVRSIARDRLTLRDLGGQTVVKVGPPALTGFDAVAKRAFDLFFGGILAIVLLPVMALAALAVLIDSGSPVLFRQQRVGLRGRVFTMVKFRTMRAEPETEDAAWTTPDDPRRTRVGRFLRRSSLDELPQLWNVLAGTMSLVGPRPEQPPFATSFGERLLWYRFRHRIKPGMTGWAQSHGFRGDTPIGDRVELDNWYIENWSIWLDLRILLMTLREVARGRNAY